MPITQVRVGPPSTNSNADNSTPDQLGGKAGEAVVAALHGKYYTQAYRGNVFVGSTAVAGVVPPASTATAQVYMIWNPQGSGKNIVPISTTYGYVSGTSLAGNHGWSYLTGMGNGYQVARGASAATLVAPVNMNLGSGIPSVANFAPATATVVAPTYLRTAGVSQLVLTAAEATETGWTSREDFDGALIVAPGTALFAITLASEVGVFTISTVWEEVPV